MGTVCPSLHQGFLRPLARLPDAFCLRDTQASFGGHSRGGHQSQAQQKDCILSQVPFQYNEHRMDHEHETDFTNPSRMRSAGNPHR